MVIRHRALLRPYGGKIFYAGIKNKIKCTVFALCTVLCIILYTVLYAVLCSLLYIVLCVVCVLSHVTCNGNILA